MSSILLKGKFSSLYNISFPSVNFEAVVQGTKIIVIDSRRTHIYFNIVTWCGLQCYLIDIRHDVVRSARFYIRIIILRCARTILTGPRN